MLRSHRWGPVIVVLIVLSAGGCGGREQAVDPEERRAMQRAYQPTLVRLADSARPPMPAVDSLFLPYDADVLRAVRPDTSGAARWVDSLMATLSLEEKIGQLFVVNLPVASDLRRLVDDEAAEAVAQGAGGFLVSRTLDPREVYEQVPRLQDRADVPLFFAADYERGAGRFSTSFADLPSNMARGATPTPPLAAAAGRLTAIESRAAGVNWLFAPVVDVNNNPDNPIINIRSYGERPGLVGRMASAFVRAAETHGLLTTLKHFPGHGNTSVDSHARLGTVTSSRAELDSVELKPYRMVLAPEGPRPTAIMTAHLWVKALDEEPIPATFSRTVLDSLLRGGLGFEGLIVTDDVKMGALRNRYDRAERVVRPLRAGADVILTPANLEAAVAAVKAAVEDGRLSEARIVRSVRRVLRAKAAAGLHHRRYVPEAVLDRLLEEPYGEVGAQAIADQALTLLKTAPVLPLADSAHTLLVQLVNYEGSESIAAAMDAFAELLAQEDRPVDDRRYDLEPSEGARTEAVAGAEEADVVVLALYLRLTSGRGDAGLYPLQSRLVRALLEQDTPVVLTVFGNPYAVSAFTAADAQLVAYDQTLASVFAAARILQGEQPPCGKLPVTAQPYAYGSGLQAVRPDRNVVSSPTRRDPAATARQ